MEQKLVMVDVGSNRVFDMGEINRNGFISEINLNELFVDLWLVKKMVPVTNANKDSLGFLYILLERN
jgi:hypothetical protein